MTSRQRNQNNKTRKNCLLKSSVNKKEKGNSGGLQSKIAIVMLCHVVMFLTVSVTQTFRAWGTSNN